MATKLKNMSLTSVDLVRAGANQEANICIFKGAEPPTDLIEKEYTTFNAAATAQDNEAKLWNYTDAFRGSIRSILADTDLDKNQKLQLLNQSLGEFDAAMKALFKSLCFFTTEVIVEMPALAKRYDEIVEVEKYNLNHDPKTGRFVSGSATGGIARRTITGGGISVHVKSGKEPKSGYMVAVYGERSQWLKGDDVADPVKREAAIKSFMDKNKDVLADKDNYLGTWYDTSTGDISLDISRNFTNKQKAIKFASEHNEKAIWDVKNMAEISTGGTGNNR